MTKRSSRTHGSHKKAGGSKKSPASAFGLVLDGTLREYFHQTYSQGVSTMGDMNTLTDGEYKYDLSESARKQAEKYAAKVFNESFEDWKMVYGTVDEEVPKPRKGDPKVNDAIDEQIKKFRNRRPVSNDT